MEPEDMFSEGVPDDVVREATGRSFNAPESGCHECGKNGFRVEAELSFQFEPLISEITEYDGAIYFKARAPRLIRTEFVTASCISCRREYDWDASAELGLKIAHAVSDTYPEPPENPPELPCPECGKTNWKGDMTERFLLEEPTLRRAQDTFRVEDFTEAGYGAGGGGYCYANCQSCENGYPLYSNDQLTGWWVAANCDPPPNRTVLELE